MASSSWLHGSSSCSCLDLEPAIRRITSARYRSGEIISKIKDQVGFVVLPRRWVLKRTFAWLNRNRRLAKDFEATISARAFLYAAAVMMLIRRIARNL